MAIEVTLAIQLPDLPHCSDAGLVAERLSQFGGELTGWTRENNGAPARATFGFETEARCYSFLAIALDIPGVSLAL